MKWNKWLVVLMAALYHTTSVHAVEIVITDRIGNGSLVDEVIGTLATGNTGVLTGYGMPGTVFTSPADGTLAAYTVSVYGGGFSGAGTIADPFEAHWIGFDYDVRVWSSVAAYLANPTGGDVAVVAFSLPSNATYLDQTGTYTDGSNNVYALHVFAFDLSSASISVSSGQEYVIAFIARGNAPEGTALQSFTTWNTPPPTSDVYATTALGPDFLSNLAGAPFNFFGSKLTMEDGTEEIPAVSTWGLGVMVLLLGVAATAMIRRQPRRA